MKRGKFIVFEGLNGCGKGTQIKLLHNHLSSSGKAVPIFSTGEPTELNDWGKKAREMLKSDGDPYLNSLEAVKYFAKNREEHNRIFGPLLEKGINVISDRYYHSNFAYQHAQGVPYEVIAEANRNVIRPDLTFIISTSPKESLRRLKVRDGNKGRKFDTNLSFNEKVYKNYFEFEFADMLENLMEDKSVEYIGQVSIENTFEWVKEIYNSKFN